MTNYAEALCPICSTENGRILRQALWDAPIALSLAAVLLPFLALVAIALVVRTFGPVAPASWRSQRRNHDESAS
jgi:hypothetical protein